MKKNADVLFIIPPFHTRNGGGSFFPLGLGYIISCVEQAGYTYEIINCTTIMTSFFQADLEKLKYNLYEQLNNFSPLLVCVGPCITTQIRALEVIAYCCKQIFPSVPLSAGGPFPSIEGQERIFFERLNFDYVIKGDGEKAVADAIGYVKENGNLSGCVSVSTREKYVYNMIDDIDTIPFPYRPFDTSIQFSARRKGASNRISSAMITSRGCMYACKYCVSGNSKNVPYRKRSMDNVLSEIRQLVTQHYVNDIVFYDDCFFGKPKNASDEVAAFCNTILESNLQITWQIELRPDFFIELSSDDIALMELSGCRQINIGIEKVTSAGLRFLGKTNALAGLQQQCRILKSNTDIHLSATFILGGANESSNDIKAIIAESLKFSLVNWIPSSENSTRRVFVKEECLIKRIYIHTQSCAFSLSEKRSFVIIQLIRSRGVYTNNISA